MVLNLSFTRLFFFVGAFGFIGKVLGGFDNTRNDNLALYWGQDGSGKQQSLSFYCQDDTVNAIPLAFLFIFFGEGGSPQIDFSNICGSSGNNFPGTQLSDCSFLASDINFCQSKGKIVTLSLGGADSKVGFSSDSQASDFADEIWDMFLGGNGPVRPLGSAVLDGVDLDIEQGTPAHYATFVNRIRSHASGSKKRYYVTAAPQCPFPDQNIGAALNDAPFDAVYVQFYNNYCGLDQPSQYNFDTWDNWAKTQSANPDVKVYIGAAADHYAAGQGYVDAQTLQNYALDAQKKYSSFGGVMMWDMSIAYANNRYDRAIKGAMTGSGSGSGGSGPNPTPTPGPSTTTKGHAPSPTVSHPSPSPSPSQPTSICYAVPYWTQKALYTPGSKVFYRGGIKTTFLESRGSGVMAALAYLHLPFTSNRIGGKFRLRRRVT